VRPTFIQLVTKLPAFYGTQRFVTMFTRACSWTVSWIRCIQSTQWKVKLFLCLTKHSAMKTYLVLNLVLHHEDIRGWRWVVSFMSQLLYSRRKSPDTHWIGGWVSPKASLYVVMKGKILCPCQVSNPAYPAHSLVITLTELSWLSQSTWKYTNNKGPHFTFPVLSLYNSLGYERFNQGML